MAISGDAGVIVVSCGLSAILDTGGADVAGAPCEILAVPTASGSDVVIVPCSILVVLATGWHAGCTDDWLRSCRW